MAKKIKEINKSHKIVLVTNGYISEEPLRQLLLYIDALNVDLKGNDEYYKRLCFRTIKIAIEMNKHVEVTTLLIPHENTDINDYIFIPYCSLIIFNFLFFSYIINIQLKTKEKKI